jgi:hypothetical protein
LLRRIPGIAELLLAVITPSPHGSVALKRVGGVGAAGNRNDAGKARDFDWSRTEPPRSSGSNLTFEVIAPGPQAAVG